MSLTTKFDTPASIRDVPLESAFYGKWHDFIKGAIARRTPGENGGAFFNPALVDVKVAGDKTMVWMGFPRRVLLPGNRDDKRNAYEVADVIRTDRKHPQDEYFEWYVHRRGRKITKVTFVTELHDYYEQLWKVDPQAVLKIYRKTVSTSVRLEDLGNGGTYDMFNRWNSIDGILHYTQEINTIGAAIGLAQAFEIATPPSTDNYDAKPPFAETTTSVDPRVDYDVHMLVRKGLYVTFKQPIGIYITSWNNSGITKPDGRPAPASWWKVTRGTRDTALRLEYEVPKNAGFVVGDLKLGGHRIEYGGQLAEQVTVGLGGVAGTKREN